MTTENSAGPTVPQTPAVQGPPQNQALLKTKNFFKREEVMAKFENILGKEKAVGFVASVLQVISSDSYLSKVDAQSIYQSAAMAAILNLPINNNLGYAWIVPYKGKAQMQIGWKGFVQLALRTREYKHINVLEVHANQFKSYDPITETLEANFTVEGEGAIAGYVAYFKLLNGFEKTVYWSTKRVTEHAKKYSKAFAHPTAVTPWKDPIQFPEMAKKTVLKNTLSKWGILSIEMERASVADQAVVRDVDTIDIDYVDNPEHAEVVDTETGEIRLSEESKAATNAEEKIGNKNEAAAAKKAAEATEAQPDSYLNFKVRTIHNTYNNDKESVEAGFVGMCTEDNGVTVTINNGEILCPRSSVRLASNDDALSASTLKDEKEEGVAPETTTPEPVAGVKSIRTDYKKEELEQMGTSPAIKNVASQYIQFDKLDGKPSNKKLVNIILFAQQGKLRSFIAQYFPGKEEFIRPTYVEIEEEPVENAGTAPNPQDNTGSAPEQPKEVKTFNISSVVSGGERNFDQMREVFDYIGHKTDDKLTDDNLQAVVDALGEGYFDFYNTIENITKFASQEEMDKIINKFLNK